MPVYKYYYSTKISFSVPVFDHHFLLRCVPRSSDSQFLLQNSLQVLPQCKLTLSEDAFGNSLFTGYLGSRHSCFEFISEGTVQINKRMDCEKLNPIYLYPTKLTGNMPNVREIAAIVRLSDDASIHQKIFRISDEISRRITYTPGSTGVKTTAAEALELGTGVCQDYAHIMLAVCRELGLAVRYVNGFMEGEGFTHAWIEYFHMGIWYGFDPTHNRPADPGYIKLAHGRDYNDCIIDKGVFRGPAQQQLDVYLKVEQIQQ